MIDDLTRMKYFKLYVQLKLVIAERSVSGDNLSRREKRHLLNRAKHIKSEAIAIYKQHRKDLPTFKRLRDLGL